MSISVLEEVALLLFQIALIVELAQPPRHVRTRRRIAEHLLSDAAHRALQSGDDPRGPHEAWCHAPSLAATQKTSEAALDGCARLPPALSARRRGVSAAMR